MTARLSFRHFFFHDPATPEIYTLSLHDALPISDYRGDGAPRWEVSEVMHVTPGDEFAATVNREVDRLLAAGPVDDRVKAYARSEEHTSELQSRLHLVCRLLLEKKNTYQSLSSVT